MKYFDFLKYIEYVSQWSFIFLFLLLCWFFLCHIHVYILSFIIKIWKSSVFKDAPTKYFYSCREQWAKTLAHSLMPLSAYSQHSLVTLHLMWSSTPWRPSSTGQVHCYHDCVFYFILLSGTLHRMWLGDFSNSVRKYNTPQLWGSNHFILTCHFL